MIVIRVSRYFSISLIKYKRCKKNTLTGPELAVSFSNNKGIACAAKKGDAEIHFLICIRKLKYCID